MYPSDCVTGPVSLFMLTEPPPADDKIRCDACPVMCYIKPGAAGACDRYANHNGELVRVDPHIVLERTVSHGGRLVPFQATGDWDGKIVHEPSVFVTAIGAGTTYPDYKPAPFIVSSEIDGIDMVTVVTEGIFSYCGVKVKIDTDRYLGPETATVRAQGEAVGHVTTAEYGSQMLSLGGVHHLTGGSKKEGRVACELMMDLGNRKPVELAIEGGAQLVVEAGKAPVVNGVEERRMRVGCGSATIGIFARQWYGEVDEVVVVDDHITGVLTEHQAGRCLDMPASGIKIKGKKSTPGRYFQVANPGTGGGITLMVDVLRMPDNSFGWVPTPAIVAPIEFTMRLEDYQRLGGHMDRVRSVADVLRNERVRVVGWDGLNPWPLGRGG